MTRFHVPAKLINMPFNKDRTLTICFPGKYTLHKSCQKNFQVNILISKVFSSCTSESDTVLTCTGHIQHAYSVVSVFPGSARSQLR